MNSSPPFRLVNDGEYHLGMLWYGRAFYVTLVVRNPPATAGGHERSRFHLGLDRSPGSRK